MTKCIVPYQTELRNTRDPKINLPRIQIPAKTYQHYRAAGLGAIGENDPAYFI